MIRPLRRDGVEAIPIEGRSAIIRIGGGFLPPTLVVDPEDGFPLGVSDLFLWHRAWVHPTKATRMEKTLPIEQKESFRGIGRGQASQDVLSEAVSVTIIADREADIDEECVALRDERTHLLIRSRQNRGLLDQEAKLFEHIGHQPVRGTYSLNIPTGHAKRTARTATIDVRWTAVDLARPQHAPKRDLPDAVQVVVIEARERSSRVPVGASPILWRLLTTHAVNSWADALQLIQWYRWRWLIEQLVRTLTHQGLDVEASQFTTGAALKKLVSMAVSTAIRILQLTLERDGASGRPATMVFRQADIACLQTLQQVYEGPTVQQKNAFPVSSLAWAAWIIGRIGGWKGYKKADPAGPMTIKRGLEIFNQLFTGWQIQKMCA